jgi:predicted DNA repair protein MutK
MAGASLLTLLDDIATVLDDVAVMTNMAAKKTAGVLGDDLALNAEQVSGVNANRELPVVWAVAVGSFKNKLILVPAALALSAFAPWAIAPLLMVGGAFLCYEGFEKIAHKFLHSQAEDKAHDAEILEVLLHPEVDMVAFEKDKIKGAIRTDFVLSGEIIIITLGTVAGAVFSMQVAVLCAIAIIMTVGVYGFVGLIVKLDDIGLYLKQKQGSQALHWLRQLVGNGLLSFAPRLMKSLTVIGTIAMFLVGGGILTHQLPMAHHWIEEVTMSAGGFAAIGGVLEAILPSLLNILAGVVAGAVVLVSVGTLQKVYAKLKPQKAAS